ncbi:MAG: universal stress protein [Candidatus Omnitrophica bacterium]|nr:universal stress protein [Candidatus Omnitrophota bacterium]
MAQEKKILIAYDGVHPIEMFIRDLKRAGLLEKAEAIVHTAANVLLPAAANFSDIPSPTQELNGALSSMTLLEDELQKAKSIAERACVSLQKAFPQWRISSESSTIAPAWGIIAKAEKWKADLVVVGTHEALAITKKVLGSVAQKILVEAPCSVRVVHGTHEETESPARIVIAVDGSPDSEWAVTEAAQRIWKRGSAIHLMTIMDSTLANAVTASSTIAGRWLHKTDVHARLWVDRMHQEFTRQLKRTDLAVFSLIKEGRPCDVLLHEAEEWGADTLLLGARGVGKAERSLIGSVAKGAAARSHCSVEVIRRPKDS